MRFIALFALLLPAGCTSNAPPTSAATQAPLPEPTGPAWFEDVTAPSGISFTYRNGEEAEQFAILESLGGGVGLIDFDRDGLLDVVLPGGGEFAWPKVVGHGPKCFRNLGGMKFQDVTDAVGLGAIRLYAHGAAVADYDLDGFPDFVLTGWGRVHLFHNEVKPGGGRHFVEVGEKAGFKEQLWASSAGWGDLDGDGRPELYVCQYGDWDPIRNHPTNCAYAEGTRDVCPPQQFKPLPHRLFRNKSDGTFEDISAAVKLRKDGHGLGVLLVDLNNDQLPDVYVCNDTDENHLYINRTKPGGPIVLEERGLPAGAARDDGGRNNGSMGIDAADYDGSGRASVFVTNYENELHALYRNDSKPGSEFFRYATRSAGLSSIGQTWVGWGTTFCDFNQDGWEDIVILNGHAIRKPKGKTPRLQPPVLFVNQGKGMFADGSAQAGAFFQERHNSRGVGFGDFDNDGAVDFLVVRQNAPAALVRNIVPKGGTHWLGLELVGKGNRDLAGSRVVVTAGGRTMTRFVKGGGSYASSADRRLVFGLGAADRIDKLEVYWRGGTGPAVVPVPVADRYHRVAE